MAPDLESGVINKNGTAVVIVLRLDPDNCWEFKVP
tara:strand:- start:222 stop:326 length:105 start_codon:yes stop_codon:yes gene_type:complete